MFRHNEMTIGEVISKFMNASQLENRVWEAKLADVWGATLGEDITRETDRIHLQKGILFVSLKSPALRNELMMRRTAIAQVLNKQLGSEVIKQIVIK